MIDENYSLWQFVHMIKEAISLKYVLFYSDTGKNKFEIRKRKDFFLTYTVKPQMAI